MPGEHNVQNATGAIAIAHHLGIADEAIRRRPRRLRRGQAAVHPTGALERRRCLRRLRPSPGRDRRRPQGGAVGGRRRPGHRRRPAAPLHAAPRPLRRFCSCFNDADTVIVAPVYPAGEAPIEGIDRDALVEGLRLRGHRDARALAGPRGTAGHDPGHRPAGRLRGLPGRRLDHAMGLCACPANWPRWSLSGMSDWRTARHSPESAVG